MPNLYLLESPNIRVIYKYLARKTLLHGVWVVWTKGKKDADVKGRRGRRSILVHYLKTGYLILTSITPIGGTTRFFVEGPFSELKRSTDDWCIAENLSELIDDNFLRLRDSRTRGLTEVPHMVERLT